MFGPIIRALSRRRRPDGHDDAHAREPAHLRAVGKAPNACAALVGVVADDALSARAALCAATVLMKLAHLERSHREAIAAGRLGGSSERLDGTLSIAQLADEVVRSVGGAEGRAT